MKLMFGVALFLWLSHCTSQASDIQIDAVPAQSTNGIIQTEINETVSLNCNLISGTHDDKELVWLRNEAQVNLKDDNKESQSRVCIYPVIYEDDGATFTCHLKSNASNKASVTLNVTYAPELSGSEEITVEEEGELILPCNMRANPLVPSVTWKLNGSLVDLSTGGFIVINDGIYSKLEVKKVERSLHEGTYQCIANSPANRSKTFQVTVTDKTMKFPLMPMIAGLVVVALTALLAIVSRWRKIVKCCK